MQQFPLRACGLAARRLKPRFAGTHGFLTPLQARRPITASCISLGQVDINVPSMAESITEGTISSIARQVGDFIEADQEFASIETDKIDVAVNAPETGRIVELFAGEGDTVTVGQRLATMETHDSATSSPEPKEEQPKTSRDEAPKSVEPADQKTSPSGKESPGKEQDIPPSRSHSQSPKPNTTPTESSVGRDETLDSYHRPGRRAEKMPRIRQTIARRLKESQDRTASLTAINRLDMSHLMQWRSQNKQAVMDQHGVRLGYMGAFSKAATLAARKVPVVNAAMDLENEVIIFRDYVDISIAVSTPRGLVTPVIRNVESKDLIEIEREIARLAGKARDSKLTMNDLEGGNFTISNPGIFGSFFGTPLINYPQSAVFNLNSIKEDVVVVDGKAQIRPMMYITLTYDNRLIDSDEAVTFLNTIKDHIESPSSMLLASTTS